MGPLVHSQRDGWGILAIALVLAPLVAAENPPDAAEQQKEIAAMKEAAVAYDRNLPNFICTQTTRREVRYDADLNPGLRTLGRTTVPSSSPVGSGEWRPDGTYEEQLTYFDHHENYSLVKVNGKRVRKKRDRPPGLTSSGEFGSTLIHIFEKESKADFEWKRWDTLRGRPVYVFGYQIARENSAVELNAGSHTLVVGYHGQLFVDRETNAILRVTMDADVPKDFPLQDSTHLLDYGTFNIAGQSFLLPLHAEVQLMASQEFVNSGLVGRGTKQATFRNTVDFTDYRRYAADATLKPD